MKKKVLCFGDSNVYGFIPDNFNKRYFENERWSGILKTIAHENYEIIEAGCNNRTAFADNNQNNIELVGDKVLPKYLSKDIDIIILALGINDSQSVYNLTVENIKNGVDDLLKLIKTINPKIKIILVCPSIINVGILNSKFSSMFDDFSIVKSMKYPEFYRELAKKYNCFLVDLNNIAKVSNKDGLHYDMEEHKKVAYVMYELLQSIV